MGSKITATWKFATTWYVSLVAIAALGPLLGWLVFFQVYPGKPKIGIIDIPFTVITSDSAFVITEYLDFVRRNDDIKGAVIKLESPGGGAAASEQLYLETARLREEKPVVIVVNGMIASGGYMMSMGANYIYAKPSSLIGNVGVRLSNPGPLLPRPPSENQISTGPFKLSAGSRRHFIGIIDELRNGFAGIVVANRGESLKISRDEVLQGKLYSGIGAVRTGMADAIGSDVDAIKKTASLAGISRYDVVDVNLEVAVIFFQKIQRITEALEGSEGKISLGDRSALMSVSRGAGDSWSSTEAQGPGILGNPGLVDVLRRLLLPTGVPETWDDDPPGFPPAINVPRIDYLYDGTYR
jgi:protease-4